MECLLTYPPKSLKKGWKDFLPFPMAPMCLGSYLKMKKIDTVIYHRQPYRVEDIVRLVVTEKPKYFGMTCDSSNFMSCFKLAKLIKSISKNTLVILGGIHATFFHKIILEKTPSIDLIVRGEGEETLFEIIESSKNKNFKNILGITYRVDNRILTNPDRPFIKNLDSLPLLSYELIDMKRIESYTFPGWWPLHTARGCSFNCKFCSDTGMWKRTYRFKSFKRVIREIEVCKNYYGIQGFFFNDLTFTTNRRRIIDLCHSLLDKKILIKWGCYTRIDCVDRSLLKYMKKSGCQMIVYGVESFSNKILKLMGKGHNVSLAIDVLNYSHSLNIDTRFELLLGYPGETKETLKENINNLKKINKGITFNNINVFQLHPGSVIYNTVKQLGFIGDELWFQGFQMEDFIHVYYPVSFIKEIKRTADIIDRMFRNERMKKQKTNKKRFYNKSYLKK